MNKTIQTPDEIYSYGLTFIAERTGTKVNLFQNLLWTDQLSFNSEQEAKEQMVAYRKLGEEIDAKGILG